MQQAQREAARAVLRVIGGANVTTALARADIEPHERGLLQELAYGTLRHWATLDAISRALASKPLRDEDLRALIAVALYQLEHTRAPAFAIVSHAVAVAGAMRPAAKGLVNALLRRFLRERETVLARVCEDPVARYAYPRWWIDTVERDHPQHWRDILLAGNERPPLTLRVNRRAGSRDDYMVALAREDVAASPVGAQGVIVQDARAVDALPGFREGAFSVQDAGAQLAALLLDVRDGMRVLDACAAPGGKTTHLLEIADVDLTAVDDDPARLDRVRENVARLGLAGARLRIVAGDAAHPHAWWDGAPFDRILADVPCTASGVIRRHPDGKWLRRESDVAGFRRQQSAILDASWPLLAPGGVLLYATCSVFRAENDAVVDDFTGRHPEALHVVPTFAPDVAHVGGQLLPSLPGAGHNQDGFFYALLRKP